MEIKKRIKNTSLVVLMTALLNSAICVAAATEWVELAPGAYARQGVDGRVFETNDMANTGIVIGVRCVAIIDTGGSRQEGESILSKVRELTDKPVCYVINTHHHPDHAFGSTAFSASQSATFIAHVMFTEALAVANSHYLPRASRFEGRDVTSADFLELDMALSPGDAPTVLDLGGRKLRVQAHSVAHTHADVTVVDEKHQILWAGDLLFSSHIPVVDGSLLGWLEVSRQLSLGEYRVVVPGHGLVKGSVADFDRQIAYLSALRDTIRDSIADGRSLMDVVSDEMKANPWQWREYDAQYQRNLTRAYTELEWE